GGIIVCGIAADYDLAPGEQAGSLAIIRAGDKIVEQLKSEGRPFSKLTERKVVADHNSDTVDILAVDGDRHQAAITGLFIQSGDQP
ncbi:hypothetical protein ACC739_37325, partial [Rhizobium ruizarguesonis]